MNKYLLKIELVGTCLSLPVWEGQTCSGQLNRISQWLLLSFLVVLLNFSAWSMNLWQYVRKSKAEGFYLMEGKGTRRKGGWWGERWWCKVEHKLNFEQGEVWTRKITFNRVQTSHRKSRKRKWNVCRSAHKSISIVHATEKYRCIQRSMCLTLTSPFDPSCVCNVDGQDIKVHLGRRTCPG